MTFDIIKQFLIGHMKKYAVAIGTGTVDGKPFPPIGSGTLVTFLAKEHKYYAILSAAHVIYQTGKTGLLRDDRGNKFVYLTLPHKSTSVLVNFMLIFLKTSYKEFCNEFLIQDKDYAPDLGFVVISRDEVHPLLSDLEFYNLDDKEQLNLDFHKKESLLSGFFRGACLDQDVVGYLLSKTGPYLGGGEYLQYNSRHKLENRKIPYSCEEDLGGSSGSALWRFHENQIISLGGIINTCNKRRKQLIANAGICIYNHLSQLKEVI